MKGFTVVVDGVNGSGKGGVIEGLAAHFKHLGKEMVLSKEPGATAFGLRLRRMLMDNDFPELCNEAKLMLFNAARAQNLREIIIPALKADKICLIDRWATSSISFQGHAEGLPISVVKAANQVALGDFLPDLTIILDIDPKVGLERARARDNEADHFESKPIDYHQRARHGYLIQAQEDPERFVVIDASLSQQEVLAHVVAVVEARLCETLADRELLSA